MVATVLIVWPEASEGELDEQPADIGALSAWAEHRGATRVTLDVNW